MCPPSPLPAAKLREQHGDRHQADQRDQRRRSRSGCPARCAAAVRAFAARRAPRGRHGGAQAGVHRADELRQRPDRRDADGAGADEAHLVAPGVLGELRHAARPPRAPSSAARPSPSRSARRPASPRRPTGRPDGRPRTARRTAGNRSRSRRRARRRGNSRATSLAKMRVATIRANGGRHDRAPEHRREAGRGCPRPRRPAPSLAAADLQHLGAGHALRIGQVGLRHQRAPQRDRIHHAEDAAEGADRAARPSRESRVHQPIITRPGSTKMIADRVPAAEATVWTMLFSWIGHALEAAQHRHRDHRGRDRGGEGEARLEPEVDVGGGEHQRDEDAQDQAAQRQLGARRGCAGDAGVAGLLMFRPRGLCCRRRGMPGGAPAGSRLLQ